MSGANQQTGNKQQHDTHQRVHQHEKVEEFQIKKATKPIKSFKNATKEVQQQIASKKKQIWFDVEEPVNSFIHREGKFEHIENGLKQGIVVISGLGGMGKSELARKYAHVHRKDYDGNVIWVNACSQETMVDSFHRLILAENNLNVPTNYKDGEQKSFELIVKDAFEYFTDQKCLFIFDSVDKLDLIESFRPLIVISKSQNLHILITSQLNVDWKNNRLNIQEPLLLNEFTDEEGRQFVRNVLNMKDDLGIVEFVNKLQNFPLALHQAVAYIKKKNEGYQKCGSAFTVKDYIVEFEKSKIYEKPTNGYLHNISKTLAVALDKIDNSLAKEILDISCYFDPNNIPSELFLKGLAANNKDRMTSATKELEKYSLVQLKDGILCIHATIQTARRQMLAQVEKTGKVENTLTKALGMLKNKVKEFDKIVFYLPHALAIWNHAYKYNNLIEIFIVKDIVEKKARINYFHLIAGSSTYEVFATIVDKIERNCSENIDNIIRADDGQKGTPLHYAASNADVRLLKLLIEKGATVHVQKKYGWTPLLLAVRSGRSENVRVLLENKAQINDKNTYDLTSLHLAARNGYPDIVETLLKHGVDVNAKSNQMFTPLHYGANMNNLKVVQLLLGHKGVDVNAETRHKMTPLIFAAKAGHLECVKDLLLNGANVNASDVGNFTALHLAACNGHSRVVNLLLAQKGIDVNVTTSRGNTPLHLAAEKGHKEIVKALRNNSAKIDLKNEDGKLASDLASKNLLF